MKNLFLSIILIGAIYCAPLTASAQIRTPAASPTATLTQQVGLTDVIITYSRPSVKGRAIFGGLVPYGELWRTGANASTKISFSDPVKVEGNSIPAGEYAIYTIPEQEQWTVILHKNTGYWGTGGPGYNKEEEAVRFVVKPRQLTETVNSFTIELTDMTLNTANVEIAWEKTAVKFQIEADVDAKVMADIDRQIINRDANSAGMYHQAATYYFETGKDLNQALEWATKASEASGGAFYMTHLKAKILAAQNKKKEAIAAAEESIKASKAVNNMDYVRLNEELIKEVKKQK